MEVVVHGHWGAVAAAEAMRTARMEKRECMVVRVGMCECTVLKVEGCCFGEERE